MPTYRRRSKITIKQMKAIILVGGKGTRLHPLTHITPKAMVPILNRPFIEYVIHYLSYHGIKNIILASGYQPDLIRNRFGDGSQLGIELIYSVEQTPLGTAGAVKNAEKYIDDTFLVINGDVFTDIDLGEMFDFHRNKKARVTIALTPVDDPTQFGVVETDSQRHITRFVEKPGWDQVTSHLINAGFYIIEPEILTYIPKGNHFMFEHHLFPNLLASNEPVFGYATDAYWIDMGTPQKYLQLTHDLLHGKSLQVTHHDKEIRIDKRSSIHPQARPTGPILVDRGCTIGKGAQLKGSVVIGSECTIGDNALIENSILWQKVTIGEHAVLKNCIIATGSIIENKAHIEGIAIGENSIVPGEV